MERERAAAKGKAPKEKEKAAGKSSKGPSQDRPPHFQAPPPFHCDSPTSSLLPRNASASPNGNATRARPSARRDERRRRDERPAQRAGLLGAAMSVGDAISRTPTSPTHRTASPSTAKSRICATSSVATETYLKISHHEIMEGYFVPNVWTY